MMEKKSSRADYATDKILELIRADQLRPGDRIPTELELTSRLHVGRGTIRESIRRLVTRNILVVQQGSGTYISSNPGVPEDPLGLAFIEKDRSALAVDLLDFRLMIEPELAARAARMIDAGKKEELTRIFGVLKEKISSGKYYVDADANFHCFIASCAGNSVLQNLMPTITTSVTSTIAAVGDIFRQSAEQEHANILSAICRNDAEGARYAMITHLNTSRDYFVQNCEK